VNKIPGSNDSS